MAAGRANDKNSAETGQLAVDILLEPILAETGAHLSAFPRRTRLCLELELASRLLGFANARALIEGEDAAALRLISIGSEIDATSSELCTQLRARDNDPEGDHNTDD